MITVYSTTVYPPLPSSLSPSVNSGSRSAPSVNSSSRPTPRHRQRGGRSRVASAASAATLFGAAIAGAAVTIAPMAGADVSLASETGTDGLGGAALHDGVDQMLAAMQQAIDYDSGLDFATETSNEALPTLLQNTNYELLTAALTIFLDDSFFQVPEQIAGDAADDRQYFQFFTPDIYYHVTAGLDPDASYELTGNIGDGTEHFTISAGGITAGSADTDQYLELGDNLVVDDDGTFAVDISPTEPDDAANHIDSGDADALLIRDMLGDWAAGPGNVHIDCVEDCPPSVLSGDFSMDNLAEMIEPLTGSGDGGGFDAIDGLDDLDGGLAELDLDSLVGLLLQGLSIGVEPFNDMNMELAESAGIQLDPNTMSELEPQTFFDVGLPSARTSVGNFDLDTDEAMVIKMPEADAAYSGIELMNVFGSGLPATLAQTTLNNTQAYTADDGSTYYVVSGTDPGVANWLDNGDVDTGEIIARFEGLEGEDPAGQAVETEVMPVGDVADYLPDDTPAVGPEEYAATMTERVLSYDYGLDTSRQVDDWLIQHALLHGLETEMGTDDFEDIFGAEPFTSMWLRLTPALSPDWDAAATDVLENPVDSLTAIWDNLGLAAKDVALPMALPGVLLLEDSVLTGAAVSDALSSDDPLHDALDALTIGTQRLASVVDDALFDPNTSITAGILNARDDLATAVFETNDDFPFEAGPFAALEWQHMPELAQLPLDAALDDLGGLFDLAEYLGS